ncbi:MAG: PH domain-containing protein [Planctomycetia bacterium]|nr:PH domain-containing protein [Planctomycetia bacterium]
MTQKPKKTTSVEEQGPWRSGRPSFKAYYPEVFLLTLVTIAFIALAVSLSCSTLKKAKTSWNFPEAPWEELTFAPNAYAQEIEEPLVVEQDEELALPEEDATDPEPETVTEPTEPADVAEPADATEPESTKASDVATETQESNESVTQAPETADAPDATTEPAKSNETQGDANAGAKTSKHGSPWTRVLWIWILCMFVPVALWLWRGCVWVLTVCATRYEIRCDPDNPRATTFLIMRGIFNRKTDSTHIGQIKDIQMKQTIWQKYLMGGVGTIYLLTPSDRTDDRIEMKNMADPNRVFNAFDELRRHYWSRGGMQMGGESFDGAAEVLDAGNVEM